MARTGRPANPLGKGVAGYYGVRQDVANELKAYNSSMGVTEDPFAALPAPSPKGLNARSGAFVEGFSVFNDLMGDPVNKSKYVLNAENFGYDVTAGEYYEAPYLNPVDPLMPKYRNLAGTYGPQDTGVQQDRTEGPAPMTVVPTSTTNLKRPRTVAAGWEAYADNPKLGKMTVIFRDGTYYNYYDVTDTEWQQFRSAPSKGPLLNPRPVPGPFMYKPRGEAQLGFLSEVAMETQYRIARTSQQVYQTESEARQGLRPGRAGRPRKSNSAAAGTNPAAKRRKP